MHKRLKKEQKIMVVQNEIYAQYCVYHTKFGDIGIADMNELSEIQLGGLSIDLKGWNQLWYYGESNHEPRN